MLSPAAIEPWQAVAREQGLILDERSLRMRGRIDRQRVRVAMKWTREAGRPSVFFVECTRYRFVPYGLEVRPAHSLDAVGELLLGPDLRIGQPMVDTALRIVAKARNDAQMLIRRPAFWQTAEVCLADGWEVRIDDGRVRLARESMDQSPDDVRSGLLLLGQLARSIRSERPEPTVLERIGAELGIEASHVTARGKVDGIEISIGRREGRLVVQIELPALRRYRIERRDEGDRGALLGDPVLDATIRVSCPEPSAAVRVLGAEGVRGPLLELVHGRKGAIDEGRLSIRMRHTVPAAIEAIHIGVELARGLERV